MRILRFTQILVLGLASIWSCKNQLPIDERSYDSGISSNTTPVTNPPVVTEPLPTTDVPVTTDPVTTLPGTVLTPTTIAQLAADMKVCNDKGLLYVMGTAAGNCLPEVRLSPVCNYDFIKAGMKLIGFKEAEWVATKKSFDDDIVKQGAVLDQCGLIGEAGMLVTHAFYQPGTKIVLGHYRNIFCLDKSSPKPGAQECAKLSTELFSNSN